MENKKPVLMADLAAKDPKRPVTYLYRRELNQGFQVDGVAQDVVARMKGLLTLREICQEVANLHNLNYNKLESQILKLTEDLESYHLISWSDESTM